MEWTPTLQQRSSPHPSPTRRRQPASAHSNAEDSPGTTKTRFRFNPARSLRFPAPSTASKLSARISRLVGGEHAQAALAGVAFGVVLWLLVGPHPPQHGRSSDGVPGSADRTIHVAITTTLSHAVGALAVINSTAQHAANPKDLHFHLIAPPADAAALELLVRADSPFHGSPAAASIYSRIQIHVDTTSTKAAVHDTESTARAADLSQNIVYARYYLAATFPELDRIIYLDADLVVLADLADLWSVDLDGKPLGAVKRCRTKMERNFMFSSPSAKKHLKRYNPKACTFNNGVMLYDLAAWRDKGYHKQLVVWTELNAKRPLYSLGSQPPFNLVFYENYHELDPSWNVMDAGEPTLQPSRQEIANAKILHWNGKGKPWSVPHAPPTPATTTAPSDGRGVAARVLSSEVFTRVLPRWESVVVDEKFTVVIVTQGLRLPQLATVLVELSRCKRVIHEVLLVWNNVKTGCPTASTFETAADGQLNVRCLAQAENQMQNRLLIAEHLETEAAFHHDDDVVLDVDSIALGFKVWRRNRNAVVGYQPRVHFLEQARERDTDPSRPSLPSSPSTSSSSSPWRYEFHLTEGYYTFVIGKAFFVSRSLMQQHAATPALVQLNRDKACEDLSINMLAAHQPGSSGCILVESSHRELETPANAGLSTQISSEKWSAARQACIAHLATYFTEDFLRDKMPRSTKVAMGYDHVHNEIVYRNVVPMESVCSDTRGIKRCRVPSCKTASNGRLPCYN